MNYQALGMSLIMLSTVNHAHQDTVTLGDTVVKINQHQQGKGNSYIHLHSNETTALKAAHRVINYCGGYLISLEHNGGRNISFHLNKKKYTFDPNRIFTQTGIRKSLTKLSHYNSQAAQEITKLSNKIMHLIPDKQSIIAVHNNRYYSMKDYYPGASMSKEAKLIYKNPKQYYRNFYFVTTQKNYDTFKSLGFNVVLQNNRAASDDGSLSVALSNREYVNVEAGYTQLHQQIKMLKATCRPKATQN